MHHFKLSSRTGLGVLAVGSALGFLGLGGVAAHAAPPLPQPMPVAPAEPAPDAGQLLTADALATLVGPIALYPDVILAGLLPATTVPLEVVAAAQYVREHGGKADQVPTDRAWEPGVQTMLQYPEALMWMADNPEWLQQMGQAVALQQADVLKAIQDFRAAAQRAGNLQSDEHATVETQGSSGVVAIEPVNPMIVYVPVYDPVVICVPYYRPALITYEIGFSFGSVGPWCWNWIAWGGYGTHFGGPCIRSIPSASYWSSFRHNRPSGTRWSPRSTFFAGGGHRYSFGTPRIYRTNTGQAPSMHSPAATSISRPTRMQRFDATRTAPRQAVPTYPDRRSVGGTQTVPQTGRRTFVPRDGQRPYQAAPEVRSQQTPRSVETTPRWTPPSQDASRQRPSWPNQGGGYFRRPDAPAPVRQAPVVSQWQPGAQQWPQQAPTVENRPAATWPQAGWQPANREARPTPNVQPFSQGATQDRQWNRNNSNPPRIEAPPAQARGARVDVPPRVRHFGNGNGDGARRRRSDDGR